MSRKEYTPFVMAVQPDRYQITSTAKLQGTIEALNCVVNNTSVNVVVVREYLNGASDLSVCVFPQNTDAGEMRILGGIVNECLP